MNPTELRQALDQQKPWWPGSHTLVIAAARSWLSLLEADEKGLTAELIDAALKNPDTKWKRGTILDAAQAYSRVLRRLEAERS